MRRFIIAVAVSCVAALPAGAVNITINDNNDPGRFYGFDGGPTGVGEEDNETEVGTIAAQHWDLEAVMLTDSILSLVGGWDFVDGVVSKNGYATADGTRQDAWDSGDVFLAVDAGMPLYGEDVGNLLSENGYAEVDNIFGYNYVLDVDWEQATADSVNYTIYAIDASALLMSGYYNTNEESTPFRYISGGEEVGTGVASLTAYDTDVYGLLGGLHHEVSFNLSDLPDFSDELWVHNTMECGNDNLMGHYSVPVPDGGLTVVLLGLAATCFAAARFKFDA